MGSLNARRTAIGARVVRALERPVRMQHHGPGMAMTHIANQEALDGTHVTWMEKVSDQQYGGS